MLRAAFTRSLSTTSSLAATSSAATSASSTSSAPPPSSDVGDLSVRRISKALETYLRNSKKNVAMMERHRVEFETGRRHLASMMGISVHELNQEAIDRAIEYLFPSGLSDPKAKPVMRPPDEILPRFQRFTFDDEGRPEGSRFFTLSPKVYGLLSDIGIKTNAVMNDLEPVNLSGSQWMSAEKLKKKLGERVSPQMYGQLLIAFDHLASQPASSIESKFIMEYREPLAASTEKNRRFATVRTHCKDTRTNVTVYDAGKGKFEIDGLALYDFRHLQAREILLAPLIVANLLGRVDVVATSECISTTLPEAPNKTQVERLPGQSSLPRAVRHGVALCLAALHPESFESLRLSGLLTLDPRKKERSKVNQPGARAKWIWKRR
ncbi:unnamed protein product [Caenorhabditis auriculariae]|uniref:Uncharacterized protein n=1 Tax=Caenorhabditis auriculariae TaxID=2777116 RepID=A0A8S1HLP6_9PELO|nr:unnamed protein product [Caenorhabditis auriculariae]